MGYVDATGGNSHSAGFVGLLAAARGGDAQALGVLLQSFRFYLLAIARREVPGDLRSKCDGSDLVQETLLEGHRGFSGFRGDDSDDLRVWLCGILRHNAKDLVRRYRDASKRSVERERSLDAGREPSGIRAEAVDDDLTPCTYWIVRERVEALRESLLRLPADEQAVIGLRHFDALPFEEVGRQLGRSPEAARKLWSRALMRLQRMLAVTEGAKG